MCVLLLVLLTWSKFYRLTLYLDMTYPDGIMHYAVGMLQSRENLPPLLWSSGAAVLHDQQSPPGKF